MSALVPALVLWAGHMLPLPETTTVTGPLELKLTASSDRRNRLGEQSPGGHL